ncbi:hypothetical protein QC761_0064990 [Podospora bellae-mahoneyi]|uniref:Protein kinase domain-containing protein n=1 Tax=Podospora bellae-mahoneyi TaxID=2093777 RepID=A0ABR0FGT8_9PEZI|nr:hypothetical protein QC761_0064990 [Podospora bellae-mahoneyi]
MSNADEKRSNADEKRSNAVEKRSNADEKRSNACAKKPRIAPSMSNADEKRSSADEKRSNADGKRSNADEKRSNADEKRSNADEKRSNADAKKLKRLQESHSYKHWRVILRPVVTDRSLTTQGDTTNPVGRLYPQRIAEWHDFPARQEEIWERLSIPSFADNPVFPSQHQMAYVESLINPISSEQGLRSFERDTVENAAQKLFAAVSENTQLRDSLGLQGTVMFESHTNLGTVDDTLSKPLERMSLAGSGATDTAITTTAAIRKPRRGAKGKGNRADQFCIYRTADGANIPAMAIEYKAPHKLSQDEIVTGLASDIQPRRDVINKDCEGFALASRALAAAVVTQLFSYMVGKGMQYGYVCTGQVFVFLYIPDDPATVFYHVCVPNLDVIEDDENRLHRTAVAQVFAFILQALLTPPPPQSWHDAAERLDIWDVEFEDVLSKIPVTVRKDKEHASPYKPQRWRGFTRSPIRTRLSCKQASIESGLPHEDDDEPPPPSPTADRLTRPGRKPATSGASSGAVATSDDASSGKGGGGGRGRRPDIQDRAYCTHQCLVGLALGGPIDPSCPNAPYHKPGHISRVDFLHLLRAQLARDRGRDANSAPLYLAGAVGSLFKVRLSTHGYTLVAKGVESANRGRLQNEENIYNQLSVIQGRHVPVCLGLIDLVLPYYCDGRVSEHFLLLSWAGQPLSKCVDRVDKVAAVNAIAIAYTELHRLRVLHCDAELRNIMYNRNIMVVDFERAEICSRQPLGPLSPNGQNRKRKRELLQKQGKNPFTKELQKVVKDISGCFGQS